MDPAVQITPWTPRDVSLVTSPDTCDMVSISRACCCQQQRMRMAYIFGQVVDKVNSPKLETNPPLIFATVQGSSAMSANAIDKPRGDIRIDRNDSVALSSCNLHSTRKRESAVTDYNMNSGKQNAQMSQSTACTRDQQPVASLQIAFPDSRVHRDTSYRIPN